MPKYSKDYQEYLKSRIRNVLVVNPRASLRQIRDNLENSPNAPLHLDLIYINKLRDKIFKERAVRNDRTNRNTRIAELQDKKERIDQQLWQEATSQANPGKTRVSALTALLKNDLDLLNAEMDAGVFERQLGTFQHEVKPLTDEQQRRVLTAFTAWGLIKPDYEQIQGEHGPETRRHGRAGADTQSGVAGTRS